jgi:hypothetical protein
MTRLTHESYNKTDSDMLDAVTLTRLVTNSYDFSRLYVDMLDIART